jgi:hypothetical protein
MYQDTDNMNLLLLRTLMLKLKTESPEQSEALVLKTESPEQSEALVLKTESPEQSEALVLKTESSSIDYEIFIFHNFDV